MPDANIERMRHPKHWYEDIGSHVFLVNNTLYRLDVNTLQRVSQTIRDVLQLPQGDASSSLGGTEADPIPIPLALEPEFDICVNMAYGGFNAPPDEEVLLRLLALGDYLNAPSTIDFALYHIHEKRFRIPSVTLIEIAIKHRRRQLFSHAFQALVKSRFSTTMTIEHLNNLDSRILLTLMQVKDTLDIHRHIAAAEPPTVTHASSCLDHAACEDDWYAVWWNCYARVLLDGRNPVEYYEAGKSLEGMDFGEMDPQCKAMMLTHISTSRPQLQVIDLIRDTTDRLVRLLNL